MSGYIPTNKDPLKSKFEFGPMNTAISGNAIEGAVSVWFMSLEELCTTLRYDNFRMHNQFYDNYAIISDQREVCDHDNATFCINWNCGWYPQLSGKFFKGAIYPTGYAPVPKAIVTAGHCSFDKEEWYQLVFTWNKPENRYQIYINGILVAHSEYLYKWNGMGTSRRETLSGKSDILYF